MVKKIVAMAESAVAAGSGSDVNSAGNSTDVAMAYLQDEVTFSSAPELFVHSVLLHLFPQQHDRITHLYLFIVMQLACLYPNRLFSAADVNENLQNA